MTNIYQRLQEDGQRVGLQKFIRPATIIACSDHGFATHYQVSAYPQKTTLEMVKNYLISQGAVANAMSNFLRSHLFIVPKKQEQ